MMPLPRRVRRSATPRSATPLLAATVLLALAAPPVAGQYDAPPPPPAYALQGVTLVQPDGTLRDSVTLVIRGGLVEALGAEVAVPGDAKLLEGEDLRVYPGMVDAQGTAEARWPEARDVEDEDDVTAWSPPRSRQRFVPHRRIADHLVTTGADLDAARRSGIVASLVHPGDGMAPGQPAVLVHRNDETPWSLVERDAAGLTLSFETAGGVYPSQLFGVIAYLRQAFMDAERYALMRSAGLQGEGGFLPPGWDPDYEALLTAVRGETPVFFRADSDEDIRRALDLADQFGFGMILVGGEEAWKLADELADRDVAVMVSLDFPRLDEWDPEADTVPGELSPAAVREKERMEAIWSNPGRLRAAGVSFALTSGGGEAEMLEGLRKVVEYGLPAEAALAAVTTTPAEILGISGLIRVAPGQPATFVVTSGDLFQEETEVRYTFVEGHLTEVDGDGGGSDETPAGDLTGSWSGEIFAGGEEAEMTLELTQSEDGSLDGTVSAAGMPTSPVSGRIAGSEVTLRIEAEGMPEPIELRGTLSADGTTVRGGGSTPFGEIEFEVTRGGPGGWAAFLGGVR